MIHGILNVYKEKGFTSHDVVAKLRGIIGQRKIGHTGTLDPDAEGVLPVCLGKATKVCGLLTEKSKTYETVLLLGKITDTQDNSGVVLEEKDVSDITENEVIRVVESFIGEYHQTPPMYSALKVNGKKLYELAREGITIERKSRAVTIENITIQSIKLPRVFMEVTCSKGTYIRTLCQDIGNKLLAGGCMESLVRTKVERFLVDESHRLSEIERYTSEGTLCHVLTRIEEMFSEYRTLIVSKAEESLLYNGNIIPTGTYLKSPKEKEKVKVCNANGTFVALYEYLSAVNGYKAVKMFFNQQEAEEQTCNI